MAIATLNEVSKIWGRVMNEFLCHSGGWNNYNVLHKRIGLRLKDWLEKYGGERSKSEKIDQFRLGASFFEAFAFEKFGNIKAKEFRTHPY